MDRNTSKQMKTQQESNKELAKYAKFFRKDMKARNVAFPRVSRLSNSKTFGILVESIETSKVSVDPHLYHFIEVGKQSQLVKFLIASEREVLFTNEALLKTYPTKFLLKRFQAFCKQKLSKELVEASFGQLYATDESKKVIDDVVLSDPKQEVSPQVRLALPTYANDKTSRQNLKQDLIELAFSFGYYFSSEQEWTYEHHVGLKGKVTVSYLVFEAKYSYMEVDLKDTLYHVTSLKSLSKIKKQGIASKAQSTEFAYPPRVFLFNDIDYHDILKYGSMKARQKGDTSFCVLKILKSKLVQHKLWKNGTLKLYRDASYSDEDAVETEQKALFTYSNIPLDLLEDEMLIYDVETERSKKVSLSEIKKVEI